MSEQEKMKPFISIITAMTDSPKWAELLIKSVRLFTNLPYEIIVIDNASKPESLEWLKQQADLRLITNTVNIQHGGAMDQGTELAKGKYICHIDLDSHFQRAGWEGNVLELYNRSPKNRLVCKAGPIQIGRPVHPPIFFYERNFFLENKLSFKYKKGVPLSIDTAQKTYWDILKLGYKVELFSRGKPLYCDTGGDEIWFSDKPTIYHHHYGARLHCTSGNEWIWTGWKLPDEIIEYHVRRTAALFREPLVQQILKDGE